MTMIMAGGMSVSAWAEAFPAPTYTVGETSYGDDFVAAYAAATNTGQAVTVNMPQGLDPEVDNAFFPIAGGMVVDPWHLQLRGDPGWIYVGGVLTPSGGGVEDKITFAGGDPVANFRFITDNINMEGGRYVLDLPPWKYGKGDHYEFGTYSIGNLTSAHLPTNAQGEATHTICKTSSGVLELYGANTYTARTEVADGRLRVSGSITGSAGIDMKEGTCLEIAPGGSVGVPVTFADSTTLDLCAPAAFTAPVTFGSWGTFNFDAAAVAGATNGTAALTLTRPTWPAGGEYSIMLPDSGLTAGRTYALIDGVGAMELDRFEFECYDHRLEYAFSVSNGVLYVTTAVRLPKMWYVDPQNGAEWNDGLSPTSAVQNVSNLFDKRPQAGDTVVMMPGEYDGLLDFAGVRYVATGKLTLGVWDPCELEYDENWMPTGHSFGYWDLSRIEWAPGVSPDYSFRLKTCGDVMVARNLPAGATASSFRFDGDAIYDGAPYIDAGGTLRIRTVAYYDEWYNAYKIWFYDNWNDTGLSFTNATLANLTMENYPVPGVNGPPGLYVENGGGTLTLTDPIDVPVRLSSYSSSSLVVSGGSVWLSGQRLENCNIVATNGATIKLSDPVRVISNNSGGATLSLADGTTLLLTRDALSNAFGALNLTQQATYVSPLPASGTVTIDLFEHLPYGSTNIVLAPFVPAELGKVALAPGLASCGYQLMPVTDEWGITKLAIVREAAADPYLAWAAQHGLGAKDEVTGGVANIFRYAFNRPTGVLSPIASIEMDGDYAIVTTPVVVNSDVILRARVSRDVSDWSNAETHGMGLQPDGTLQLTYPADEPRLFFRLVAE